VPHYQNKISALPSQFLKWQPKILTIGKHQKTENHLKKIKWHNFISAPNAFEGFSRCYDSFLTPNPVDLILLDMEMPHLNGIQFLKQIQGDHHFANVQIILCSEHTKALENLKQDKKFPNVGFHLVKQKMTKQDLIFALSNSLLEDDIQSYRQKRLMRNILINDLFKDRTKKKGDWSYKPNFQKLVNLSNMNIEGHELLMRWRHKGKDISPEVFIPLAEEMGLIKYIDQRALEFAAQYSYDLHKQNKFMTVNVSPLELRNEEYLFFLSKISRTTPFFKETIRLEITETAAIQNEEFLNQIEKMGFKIIMDDFGIGMANFSLFYKLASKKIISKIKIDKSFFHEMFGDGPQGQKFMKGLFKAFHAKHVDILVEGIETREELEFLQKFGIPIWGQGYYLGKPEPIAA
jgi:EAL domain-containing protein (putative c-di-GMP-specific phosphodiesterase class I)